VALQGSGGSTPLERFTLIEKVGRGGMGVVWRARDDETGQIVAIKLLHAAYADQPDYVARFERELELARRIHSKNVVEVLGYGVRDGTPYLALQYVDGRSLRQLITEHGPYTWDETRALLIQVATGLKDAHAAGVVHRDVKPSNVLIGSDGVAMLADFGIARGIDLTRVTGTSTLLGTPAYLAPEGAKDERADMYSLGVVAYELLAGVPPFDGESFSDVLLAHIRSQPDLMRLPEVARPLVGWLLGKDPNSRPQTANELLAALEGKRKVPAPVPLAAGAAAASEAFTRPLGSSNRAAADRRDGSHRRRRVLASLLAAAFVVALVAGAVLGSQAGFGQGPRPTSSALIAAGGAEQPSDLAPTGASATGPTGQGATSTSLGSSDRVVATEAVTPGQANPTPTALVTPTPKAVTAAPVAPAPVVDAPVTPAPITPAPITAAPITAAPITAAPITAAPITAAPITAAPITPAPLQPPAAPSGITASAQSSTTIWIGWVDNSNSETGFTLSDNSSNAVTLAANTNSYTWTVSAGTSKCFEVRAFNGAGASSWTSWACATTPIPVTRPPCASSTNLYVYSGTGWTGSSVYLNFPSGDVNNVTNLPWTPKSFSDPNSASHIVMMAGKDGSGNPTHYDSAQSDISNISNQSATGWSVRAYVKTC
jgi:eukaryotic-like serine/threonine-protein kinase